MGKDNEPRKWRAARSVLAQLRELMGVLPTASEREELARNLDTIIRFLTDLRANIGLLPSAEDTSQVDTALRRLDELLEKTSASRILAPAVGVKPRKAAPHARDAGELQAAKQHLQELQPMPVDELRTRLMREDGFSLKQLKSIAFVAHVRGADRLPREAIAHQLVMKIANRRGYEGLSTGDHTPEDGSVDSG